MNYLLVFIGGGIGSMLRHGVNRASLLLIGPSFPAGTLFVNVVGSAIMGLVAGWFATRGGDEPARLFLTTGIVGGFTTFSAFSLDTAVLWERADHLTAAAYVVSSVVASIAALFVGLWAARSMLGS